MYENFFKKIWWIEYFSIPLRCSYVHHYIAKHHHSTITNMKKLILGLFITAMSAIGANAQIFWEVSGKDAKASSYLLGTHHLAPLSMLDSIKGFTPALQDVDAVAGEIDMADMQTKAQQLAGYMLAPADSMLTAVLTPAQADSLITLLTKYMGPQMTAAQLAPLKPAAVATQLALFESMAAMSPEQAQAMAAGQQLDSEVQTRALAAKKQIIAFETAEQQMDILMGAPIADQARQLMVAVRDGLSGKLAESARKLTEAYMTQDLDAMTKLMFDPESMTEDEMRRFITDRNLAWVKRLEEVMPQQRVLVAVGAGHLLGQQGLIELLRAKGYTVSPVK